MRVLLAPLLTLALAPTVAGAESRLAPIPREQAASTHGPYEMGACETCHQRADPKNPGPASTGNDTCFECHDEFRGGAKVRMEKAVHPPTSATLCVGCHSPHNARNKKLLLRP